MSKPALRASVRILSSFTDALENEHQHLLTGEMRQRILELMCKIIDEEFITETLESLEKSLDKSEKNITKEEDYLKKITDLQVVPTERLMDIFFDWLCRSPEKIL